MELILLRPLWLLALLPWLWQGWRRRRQRPLLAPAMGAYLLPGQGRTRPWLWLACLPVILALSGPALRQHGVGEIQQPDIERRAADGLALLAQGRAGQGQDHRQAGEPEPGSGAALARQQILSLIHI